MSDGTSTSPRTTSRPLADLVALPTTDARIERQWANVSARVGRTRRSWRWLTYVAVAALGLLVGVLVRARVIESPALSWEGTTIESAAAAHVVKLPDGTELVLGDAALLRVQAWSPGKVVLGLERGRVEVDVAHVEGRKWVLEAAAFDVRVVGTKFVVTRAGESVDVEVVRGRVEVARRDGTERPRSLGAGETWHAGSVEASVGEPSGVSPRVGESSAAIASAAAGAPSASDAAGAAGSTGAAPTEGAVADARSAAPPSADRAQTWEELAKARKYKEAYAALGDGGFPRAADGAASAEKLFRLAEVARASGHLRDAERAFDMLRTRHRGDVRAGLAAFELGRLRLDSLGNPAGAAEALADAIALAPGAPFREDAEARRVQALDALGNKAACATARDAYLSRYPSGAHAATVRTRCVRR